MLQLPDGDLLGIGGNGGSQLFGMVLDETGGEGKSILGSLDQTGFQNSGSMDWGRRLMTVHPKLQRGRD